MHTEDRQQRSPVTHRLLLTAVMLLTALLSLKISSRRALWFDEFLEFYTDNLPTAWSVLEVQLHHPVSLDPPAYHLLSHLTLKTLGQSAVAFRLPSLTGFLLMQISVFAVVRRAAGERAALLAALFPLFTATFHYSFEARPYGFLLGVDAAALACWFIAYRREVTRPLALVGLAACLVLAVTSHFFGLLVFLPVGLAELTATWQRRRVDWATALTIAASATSVITLLPFSAAVAPFRAHYPSTGVYAGAILTTFREMLILSETWQANRLGYANGIVLLSSFALLAASILRFRRRSIDQPAALWAAIAGFALLPCAGWLLSRFVTHTMESRYLIPTVVAWPVLFGLAVAPLLRRRAVFVTLSAALLALGLGGAWLRLKQAEAETEVISTIVNSAPNVPKDTQGNLYIQDLVEYFTITYYSPDPWIRSHLVVIYDPSRELKFINFDTFSRTVEQMRYFTPLRAEAFCSFVARPDTLFVHIPWRFDWSGRALAASHIATTTIGSAYLGNLERVHGQPVCRNGEARQP